MADKIAAYIAVFIPTANCRAWLPAAIDSIVHQTYPYKDLYVVDDCAGDVDETLVAKYPGVSFLSMKAAGGPYVIDNMLLQRTRSPYVAFHDADDLCHFSRFEHQLHEMSSNGWDGCGTWSVNVDIFGNPIGFETFPQHISPQLVLDYQYPVRHPSTLYHRHVFDKLKGFDNSTRFGADAEFLLRSFLSFKMGNVQKFLYRHTIRPGSLTQGRETGFMSQRRLQYNTPLFEQMEAILAGKRAAPEPGYLLTGNAAGTNELPEFELLQLGRDNHTWIA